MSSELSGYERRVVGRIIAKGKTPRQDPPQPPLPPTGNTQQVSIDAIVNAGNNNENIFYDNTQVDGKWVGLPIALEKALAHGFVPNLIEFLAAKVLAPKAHDFWKQWYTVHTEENIGIDKRGKFYDRNTPVLVIVNGGGILTPNRIRQAYSEGLINNSARYTDPEFDELLEGKLPDGTQISLLKYEDIKTGIQNRPHRFGVVMPYALAQETNSGYHQRAQFLVNPLVIARGAGDIVTLEKYFDLAKDGGGNVRNSHPFTGRDATVPQGRLLFGDYRGGLDGDSNLDNGGRFVAVGAGGAGARK